MMWPRRSSSKVQGLWRIKRSCRPFAAIVIDDGVAGDLIDPAFQLLHVPERVYVLVDVKEDVLQQVLSSCLVGDASPNKLLQGCMEGFPDALCRCLQVFTSLVKLFLSR